MTGLYHSGSRKVKRIAGQRAERKRKIKEYILQNKLLNKVISCQYWASGKRRNVGSNIVNTRIYTDKTEAGYKKTKGNKRSVFAKSVGLQYILDSRQKRMQGKRQSVIVELLHKTVRKELTLRGNYNTGYEV